MGRLVQKLTYAVRMLWKRALSYRKSDWELEDYPIQVREQTIDPSLPSRIIQNRFAADILGLHVSGGGATRAEALAELQGRFSERKALKREAGEALSRPGTQESIEFAAHECVDRHPELKLDFIHRILQLEWAWVSDESTLWNFHMEETNGAYCARIKEVYGVDVSDVESANIAEILERIATARRVS